MMIPDQFMYKLCDIQIRHDRISFLNLGWKWGGGGVKSEESGRLSKI
jgi:hypothetical protein